MSEIANMPEQVPPGEYEDIVMPEQHRHLANKCEDIVNLWGGGRRHIVSPRAQFDIRK